MPTHSKQDLRDLSPWNATGDFYSLTWNFDPLGLTVTTSLGPMIIDAAPRTVYRRDTALHTVTLADAGSIDIDSTDRRLSIQGRDIPDQPDLSIAIFAGQDRFSLICTLHNTLPHAIEIIEISPITGVLALPGGAASWRFYKMGSSSLAPSGPIHMDQREAGYYVRRFPIRLLPGPIQRMIIDPAERPASGRDKRAKMRSWGFTLLERPGAQPACLLGFGAFRRHFSRVEVRAGRAARDGSIECTALGDGARLDPDDEFQAHPLHGFFSEQGTGAADAYASQLAKETPPRRRPLSLWCSWYSGFYDRISTEGIEANLAALAPYQGRIEFFQLDDGYAQCFGDWLAPHTRYPLGLEHFAARVREAGFKPGVWLAPFAVSPKSSIFRDHPDWLVYSGTRRSSGREKPLLAGVIMGLREIRPYYALDTTHPEAIDWLKSLFGRLVDLGFELFKIDFLSAGTAEGLRFDPRATRADAYGRGLSAIREAVGERVLLAAVGPMLANIGLVDVQRVGTDTCFGQPAWRTRLQRLLGDEVSPGVRNNLRGPFARYFFHDLLWTSDCDAIVQQGLRPDEARTHMAAGILLGGTLCIGHDMRRPGYDLEPLFSLKAYRISRRVVPDLMSSDRPRELMALGEKEGTIYYLYLVCNWEDRACEIPIRPPAPFLGEIIVDWSGAIDFWAARAAGVSPGDRVEIPAHGCRLFIVPVSSHPM